MEYGKCEFYRKTNSLLHKINLYAKESPDKVAIIEGYSRKEITYRELWINIQLVASAFRKMGLKKCENVILHNEQSVDYVCTYYGVMLAGGVAVPIEPSVSESKLTELSKFFNARFIMSNKFETGTRYCFEHDSYEIIYDFDLPCEDELSLILYTTGTTGESKGVSSSYGSRFYGADNVRLVYNITENDVALIPQLLSHSGALRRFEAMIISGATAVIMNPAMFFGDLFKALRECNCTILQLVPAQVASILRSAEKLLAATNSQLRILSVGSAVILESQKERLRELLPDVRLFNDFGSTEAIGSAYFEWSAYPPKPDCVGIEAPHSKIVFVDENNNEVDTKPTVPGIIATEGKTIMSSYYNEPELTSKILKDGRLISSDIGYRGLDAMVYVVGRKSDIIVSGANKISPFEVEDVVLEVEGVLECAVIGKPDDLMGQLPSLFIVVDKNFHDLKLFEKLNERLERFKIPKADNIYRLSKLPRADGTGKIIKTELEKLF